ncbi:MAG: OmpA family protein [Flavobacteriales bacterium]|nr:OmpA family protein [Flavobacteriales bacterium]
MDWVSPNPSTPDYFNQCSESEYFTIPKNDFGYHPAHSGLAYYGILLVEPKSGWMEHIQSRLLKPLEPNRRYEVSFYIRFPYLASLYSADQIGVHFSEKRILTDLYMAGIYEKQMKPHLVAHIENETDSIMQLGDKWVLISGIYKAKGGEEFITIGMFWDDSPKLIKRINKNKRFGKYKSIEKFLFKKCVLNENKRPEYGISLKEHPYYFIDDVSVIAVQTKTENIDDDLTSLKNLNEVGEAERNVLTRERLKVGTTITLSYVFFEINKWELLPESFRELNSLVEVLKESPSLKIAIKGHTDNTRAEEQNLELSENRVRVVSEYLASKGIEATRLQYKGYGSSLPVTSSETEEGRQKNRRVEILILKK